MNHEQILKYQQKFTDHFQKVDGSAQITLKGHLLVEEAIGEISKLVQMELQSKTG